MITVNREKIGSGKEIRLVFDEIIKYHICTSSLTENSDRITIWLDEQEYEKLHAQLGDTIQEMDKAWQERSEKK